MCVYVPCLSNSMYPSSSSGHGWYICSSCKFHLPRCRLYESHQQRLWLLWSGSTGLTALPHQLLHNAKTGESAEKPKCLCIHLMYTLTLVSTHTHAYIYSLTHNTHTHACSQPFVHHHLEKTTIRNQKARKEEGELLF